MRTVLGWAPLAAAAAAQNVLEIGLHKIYGQPGTRSPLLKRQSTSSGTYIETLVNNITGGGYYAKVSVGTPAQAQTLVIDTGSSDIWVVGSDADLCTSAEIQEDYNDSCSETYNASASSTYKLVQRNGFYITYLDESGSSGDYFTDTFSIAGASIANQQMGYARETMRGTGIMGVGFNASVSADTVYPTIMDQFHDQGLIATKAFSLYLNDYRSDAGSILFGGIDTDKFIGNLSSMSILQSVRGGNSTYVTFAVALRGLSAQTEASGPTTNIPFDDDLAVPAILDSGTTLTFLPGSLAEALFKAVGAYTDSEETDYTFIDCDKATAGLTLTFVLGNATIRVPASQVVLDVFANVQDQIPPNVPFQRSCLFGIQNLETFATTSGSGVTDIALLGDTFLRSAYVVYDLTHNQIAVAQANLNSTTSRVVALQASETGIPALTGVASQQTASPTSSSSSSSGSRTATATATATASPSASGGSSQNAAVPSGPDSGVLVAAGMACLFSLLGGVMA